MSRQYDTLELMVVEGSSEASCSPLEVTEDGSRTTMSSSAVLIVLLCDTVILLLPPAPEGMPASVMVVPMARMPAPFDGAGPSRGGGEGIVELEENNLHRDLGSIPISVTPFLRIPPPSWYGN
jgi:hypothetical protein